MTVMNERTRPSGQTEAGPKTSGEEVQAIVSRRTDSWQRRLLRAWPAVVVYLLGAGGTTWAAAWTMVTDPGLLAGVLVGVAAGNVFCASLGIQLVVRR